MKESWCRTNWGICLHVVVVGLGLRRFLDFKFKVVEETFVLGIKRRFDELFDDYLVAESMWGFRALIGKKKRGLILDCKEEENERFFWCSRAVSWVNSTIKKEKKERKRENRKRENITQRSTRPNAQNTQ